VNHVDVASNYSGILMAMTNTVANINGFLAPFVIGEIVTTAVFPIINFPSQFVLVKLIHYFRLF